MASLGQKDVLAELRYSRTRGGAIAPIVMPPPRMLSETLFASMYLH
jgi:hypothetical protein